MLNYMITIAISAFFVPHYLGGLFFPFLKSSPGDIFFGIGVVAVLCAINVVGVTEAARAEHRAGDHRLLHPAAAGASSAPCWCFSPHILIHNVHLGTARTGRTS